MSEIEKPGELEVFRATIDKIRSEHVRGNSVFFQIKSNDLSALEMHKWEVYKKVVADFYKELSVVDLKQEEDLLRGMYRNIETLLNNLPIRYENESKRIFYTWLKGRFTIIHEDLEKILNGRMPAISLQNMKDDMQKNLAFFDAVS